MKFLFLLLLSTAAHAQVSHLSPVLINGEFPEADEFPEVVQVFGQDQRGRWSCTATIIGSRVVMTAAHCVGEHMGELQMADGTALQCEQHPIYDAGNQDADIALCVAKKKFEVVPAVLAKEPMAVGDQVQLSGYGCTNSNRQGAGALRVGFSHAVEIPAQDGFYFETFGQAALCFGDSGGPAFVESEDDRHVVAGVNSRGNIKDYSLMTAVWTDPIKSFIRRFEKHYRVRVAR